LPGLICIAKQSLACEDGYACYMYFNITNINELLSACQTEGAFIVITFVNVVPNALTSFTDV